MTPGHSLGPENHPYEVTHKQVFALTSVVDTWEWLCNVIWYKQITFRVYIFELVDSTYRKRH